VEQGLLVLELLLAQQVQVLVQEHFLQLVGAEVLPQQVQVQQVPQVQQVQVLLVLVVQVGLQQSLP